MKKILLIESNDKIRNEASDFLTNHGYDLISITDGAVGVQKALQELPDIILCDSDVPGLNGYQVFNTLQQINSTSIIPFIFLTEKSGYEDMRAAMNLGADDYIAKPVDYYDLQRLIEIRLDKQEKIINIADQKFNTLMEYSATGVLIYQDEKISYVNQKVCEILGYSKRELEGMSIINIIFKDDIPLVVDKIERCFKGIQTELKVQFKAIRRDQQLIDIDFSASVVDVDRKPSLISSLNQVVKNSNVSKVKRNNHDLKITMREQEILEHICMGFSNHQIADKLNISERTVEGHRANLLNKTNCRNSVCLAVFAIKHGLYEFE